MSYLKELKNDIAASLYMQACCESELLKRDFLQNVSEYGVQHSIKRLEDLGALYYKGKIMHIKKKWAKENLTEYEIEF